MPAGKLGELTGLTTGAVTGVIDRLEKAGYVRRTDDPKDRRKIIIEPTRNKKLEKRLEGIFAPLGERIYKVLSSCSDSELAFLLDILTRTLDESHQELMKLRQIPGSLNE
jgi:DNA-binding MarR family transcriptional regulator